MSTLNDIRHELASLGSAYPPFVVSDAAPEPGEIPIFVFHSIDPTLFESQLQYLCHNGYRTIGLAEHFSIVTGAQRGTGREVLLTIDDARSSVWRYGLPLLRRYECRAAVFVIAGWTQDKSSRPSPNLDAVDGSSLSNLDASDPHDQMLCSWEELRQMQSTGLVDVSSHTWLHRRVFVSERCTGFIGANNSQAPFDASYSPYLLPGCDPWARPPSEYFGLPLFETAAALEARPAWRLQPAVMDECRRVYAEELRAGVRDWRARMARRLRTSFTSDVFYKSAAEQVAAEIESEIALARDALRSKLSWSDAGDFLCIPFSAAADEVAIVARRLGVKACFWGVRPEQRHRVGLDPLYLARIKNDFLWRLPGVTRRSLARIYSDKLIRRLRGESPY